MKAEQLNEYLGEIIYVRFHDGGTAMGMLEFVPRFSAQYGFRHSGFYYIGDCGFKATHVQKLRKIEDHDATPGEKN